MVNIHPLPHERLTISVEPDRVYSPSAVGGPNTSPQLKSVLVIVQIGFVVHV